MVRTKTIAIAVAGSVAFGLFIAVVSVVLAPPKPLTAIETRLVGGWNQVMLPDEACLSDIAFEADRTFHANDGQFIGQWWISTGQLHVKYWRGDWREDWSNCLPRELWESLRRREFSLNIRFVDGDDRIEMAEPGEPPSSALIRR